MSIVDTICKSAALLGSPAALHAIVTWPKFSITSYFLVRSLVAQDISPRTVIDVGGNVGQFAVASAKLLPDPRIYSFEPHPDCFRELQKNVRTLANVSTFQLALGHKEDLVEFHMNSHTHSSSVLRLAPLHRTTFPDAREVGIISIKLSTLDQVFASIELERPALLKLDVQGYEKNVLEGGRETLRRIDYVVLETSFKPMYQGEPVFMELVETMASLGFSFVRPVGTLVDPATGEHVQMDALFRRD